MSKSAIRSRVIRLDVARALYFITIVTHQRRPYFNNDGSIAVLRKTLHIVAQHHPFGMRGYVFLPDHLHLLIQLKEDTAISNLIHSFKRNTTLNMKRFNGSTKSLTLWQRSFYDHVIRNERDFQNHLNYIHYNPVKHGLVQKPEAYPHSSYQTHVERGWYEIGWGHTDQPYDDQPNHTWGE